MRQDLNSSKTVYENDFITARCGDKQVLDFFYKNRPVDGILDFGIQNMTRHFQAQKYTFKPLGEYIEFSVCGYRGKTEFTKKGIPCIEALCILSSGTGIDVSLGRNVPINGKGDKPNKRTKVNDLLLLGLALVAQGERLLFLRARKTVY